MNVTDATQTLIGHDFSFPLNVYAALLQWSEGQLRYLHYGLFDSVDEPAWRAQERASDRLWAQMPVTGRVLDVGIGMGTTLQKLRERGFDALGITPELAQAEALRHRLGADLPVAVTRLEDMGADTHGHFDVMVLQESAQYIQPQALFEAADRLMSAERSTLIVMDEFAQHRITDTGLHLLSPFKALARGCGWRLMHDEDVTGQARLTVDLLLRLLRAHRERLLREFPLSDADLDGLVASLMRYAECYANGAYGYHVMRFERAGRPAPRPTAPIGFPLSVYAAALQLDQGRVDHLHPGCFDSPVDALAPAQQRAAEHLWDQMPGPCRVLQVGVRTGDLLRRMGDAGYAACGLTHDAGLAVWARVRGGAPIDLAVGSLADLPTPQQPFELLVLHDAVQALAPLALFEAADRLMVREGAQMLVMDEFVLRSDAVGHSGLPSLTSFVALAGRCGWRVELDHDLSSTAVRTFDAIETLLERHRHALCGEQGVAEPELQRLIGAARRSSQDHADGRWTYRLLRLRRPAAPALRLAGVGVAHSTAVRALFPARFGHELSAAEWHWKYGEGRGCGVGLFDGERLVAHYGGLTRRVHLMGEPVLACQVGDVMVTPEVNGGLVRNSALHKITATFLESQIGWGLPHAVGFGFPNARAMRLAQRLGLYGAVDEVHLLTWPADADDGDESGGGGGDVAVVTIDAAALRENTTSWSQLEALWQAMATAHATSALAVRDPAWLRYRYGQRPATPYVLQQVLDRDSGATLGLVVLRVLPQAVELIDLVGDPQHYSRLVRHARRAARVQGRPRLEAWITASHAHELIDPAAPPVVHTMDVAVPANAHTPGFDPALLQSRWFLMGGDTDFR